MAHYQLLVTNNDHSVGEVEVLVLENDEAALKIAREAVTDETGCEVWQGDRLVGGYHAMNVSPVSHGGYFPPPAGASPDVASDEPVDGKD
jgi:hypothetical protein